MLGSEPKESTILETSTMDREDKSDPIPMDIILEILSKSSVKSIARFGLASKFCASILSRPDFTELYLTRRPSTRPRLLFVVRGSTKTSLYSSPQPQNLYKNRSRIVAADFLMQSPGYMAPKKNCDLISGLLYFPSMKISKEDRDKLPVVCNPSTGQYVRLPQLRGNSCSTSLLGYDPIGKQYKVLAITNSRYGEGHILTLGTGKMSWRKIQGPVNNYPKTGGICINGVLYYIAVGYQNTVAKIACFDVRSERLTFLDADSTTRIIFISSSWTTKLINYKGKLGVISFPRNYEPYEDIFVLHLWTLDDAQKQRWLRRGYPFPINVVIEGDISVVGVTTYGEIILSMNYNTFDGFFVFCFNPERKVVERVKIQGFEEPKSSSEVYTFVDYAGDFKFI